MLPLLKNVLLTDDSDFQLLCSQNVCHIYVYEANSEAYDMKLIVNEQRYTEALF